MIYIRPVPSRKLLTGHLLWFLLWLFVTVVAIFLKAKPEGHGTHTELGLPPCPSVMFFGRPCPGCGLTTSFTATVHGQFAQAFHAHPFGPILYLALTVSALTCMYGFLTRQRFDFGSPTFSRALGAFVIVFFVFGVVRFALSPHYGDNDVYHRALLMTER